MTTDLVQTDMNTNIFATHAVVELTAFRQQHGTVPVPMEFNVTERQVGGDIVLTLNDSEQLLADVQEMVRAGEVRGIAADPTADLTGFHAEAFRASGEQPNRIMIRAKAEFG